MIRKWLAAILRDDTRDWPFTDSISYESILTQTNAEGVTGLLNDRFNASNQDSGTPSAFKEQLARLARTKGTAIPDARGRMSSHTGLPSTGRNEGLLLKGSALAYWAYPSPHLRECSDIDLLFRSHAEAQKAAQLLQAMQYSLRDPAPAGDLTSFEHTCVRNSDGGNSGLEIDLHWRLSSSPVFAFQFDFDELNSSAIALTKLGAAARGLSPMHAFFNACMHRVQNMADGTENNLKWLYDLHLLSLQFKENDWQMLGKIAIERKLSGTLDAASGGKTREFNTANSGNCFGLTGQCCRK